MKFGKIVTDPHASNICEVDPPFESFSTHVVLFCTNLVEALAGTLKAAKKRGVVTYNSEILLQGPHNDVEVVLLQS